jgi:hypothetical protein
MSNATYLWEESYMAAIYETDDANMPSRIFEAVSAIEQRLLNPVEHGSEKEIAITMLNTACDFTGRRLFVEVKWQRQRPFLNDVIGVDT